VFGPQDQLLTLADWAGSAKSSASTVLFRSASTSYRALFQLALLWA